MLNINFQYLLLITPSMKIGTDIVNLKRITRVYRNFNNKFAERILSTSEFEHFRSLNNERRRIEYLGGRFCGKEAIFKASKVPVTWKSVSIETRNYNSGPIVLLNGKPWDSMSISISHEEDYAVATALCTK